MQWPDYGGTAIRVTDERLAHVLERAEMAGQEARLAETLREPDVVVKSTSDADVRLYFRHYANTAVTSKHLCAVVKWLSHDRFLIAAYLTDRVKRGDLIWEKS